MTVKLTSDNFQSEVLDYQGTVLIDFWAPWCGPCRMVGPIIEELASEFAGKIKVGKINTDENMLLSANYNIMSIPTIMLFKNGQLVEKVVGAVPKGKLAQMIEKSL